MTIFDRCYVSILNFDIVMQVHYYASLTHDLEIPMSHVLELESSLTDRYQTTVPETVRRALHLSKRDKLSYKIQPDGTVLLGRAESSGERDSALGAFLHFLAQDIKTRPYAIGPLDSALQTKMKLLIGTLEVDLDSPLSDEE